MGVDPWFLVHSALEDAKLIRQAREVNNAKPEYVLNRLRSLLDENLRARVACLGLAFKANVDDLRESPALMIAEKLAETYGERVIAVEPFISKLPESLAQTGALFMDALSAIEKADVIAVLTDHRQFQMIDVNKLGDKVVVDTRGLWRKG